MPDLSLTWGGDLQFSSSGDIAMADNETGGQQRVIRRLLTSSGDYLWHGGYGAGLGTAVGTPAPSVSIESIIRAQIMNEASVAKIPPPNIGVTSGGPGSIYIKLQYVDSSSGVAQALSFPGNS